MLTEISLRILMLSEMKLILLKSYLHIHLKLCLYYFIRESRGKEKEL